jgi:DNA-binding NtrC family response regulator
MSQGQPLPVSTILLIEADPSLRRLMMLGLCHDGMHMIEASSVQELPAFDTQALDLLVVDVDQGVKSDWSLLSTLREQAHFATLPIIALSWESAVEDKVSLLHASLFSSLSFLSSRATASTVLSNVTYLSKPFDARALHRTISKLLVERAAQKAAQVALVEAQVLASYEQHAAPSIWPVVTAAGLLLVVTGLLFQFLVALVGVVLMLTSLLLWTLGTKPIPSVSAQTAATSP